MSNAHYVDTLHRMGFERIGELNFRLCLSVWWNPVKHIQVILMPLGDATLIKAEATYYLESHARRDRDNGSVGETWARDLGLLHDYCEAHFPEVRIAFSHFRDVPMPLAQREAQRFLNDKAPMTSLPTVETIANLQRKLNTVQQNAGAAGHLLHLSSRPSDLLSSYIHQQSRSQQPEINQLKLDLERQEQRMGLLQQLQREYLRKGSAAVYSFSISSNIQIAERNAQFADALNSAVAEIVDYDRFQIRQKLQGGRLKIHVIQATQPVISWIETWLGGALSPQQLHRLDSSNADHAELIQAASEHVMVTPDEPIVVNGATRQAPKRFTAQVLQSMLSRIDATESPTQRDALDGSTPDATPLRMGHRVDDHGAMLGPAVLPMRGMGHGIISGTTGSGKSFFSRVLVEEASQNSALRILILDPRNQFAGLLVPEDRAEILERYKQFGLRPEAAMGFPFEYFAPGSNFAPSLPDNLSLLAGGRSIVSLKYVDETQRCSMSASILDAAFATYAIDESDHPRLLIVIEEAHLLTRRRVGKSAASAATQSEQALDRIAREGRKYGVSLMLVTQTIKDFSHDLASLRQMAATKIFLRNSDREIEYAADILPDAGALVHLRTATALLHNANWGVHRLHVRPPFSKVSELTEEQLRHRLHPSAGREATLSAQAKSLLATITAHLDSATTSLNLTQLAAQANLTSRRKLGVLVAELERTGFIRTHQRADRGKPKVVELVQRGDE